MDKYPAIPARRSRERAKGFAQAIPLACWLIFATGITFAAVASAHFLLNLNIRVIHVDANDSAVNLYVRAPMPLIVAGFYNGGQSDPLTQTAPFTLNRLEGGATMHYVDVEHVKADPLALGRLVAAGHHLLYGGRELTAEVIAVRLQSAQNQTRFATLVEAKAALKGPVLADGDRLTYVGDTVVDVALRYPAPEKSTLALSSSFAPNLKDIEKLANLILYHTGGRTYVYRITGLLDSPVMLYASSWDAATSFIGHGVEHILEGVDHILFVVCLTIGATSLGNLLWRITGFTLGHSATLAAGFFGVAPTGSWFIPCVELAIAVSIVYAGAIALLKKPAAGTFVITAAIGLLHGFGFSFMLREVLQVGGPYVATSLVSFNLGIELGQVAVVTAVWSMLYLMGRASLATAQYSRVAIAGGCIAIAGYWTAQRAITLAQIAST